MRPPWPFPNFTRNNKAPAALRQDKPAGTLRVPAIGSRNEARDLQALAALLDKRLAGNALAPAARRRLHDARDRIGQRLAGLHEVRT